MNILSDAQSTSFPPDFHSSEFMLLRLAASIPVFSMKFLKVILHVFALTSLAIGTANAKPEATITEVVSHSCHGQI